ncbi:DsbA family protein [Variovorax sp. RT4R15]|uniref:DsbA family protein n=1 Tax=Variovorax sp. RT4R15 TaxID=3443737 RepID=UPI003F45E937
MNELTFMKLIFVADPMCSWCYGFAKEMSLLHAHHPSLPIEIRVGGVGAGETRVLSDEMKRFRLGHWSRVETVSGLPFNREAFMALKGFVYDTEPACRAMVATRRLAPTVDPLRIFRAIQRAFYVDGRDITKGSTLSEVGAAAIGEQGFAVSTLEFLAAWSDPATIRETAADFQLVRAWGISSFPALVLERNDGQLQMVTAGYTGFAELQETLAPLLEARRPAAALNEVEGA